MCLFITFALAFIWTFINIYSLYIFSFSCSSSLNAIVLSSEHFYRNKIEVDLIRNTCVDAEGNIYLGIVDLNDAHAFYLNLLYRNNNNISIKYTHDGFNYERGIYLNRPVTL